MIFKIRDTLKDADQNECFTTLFKYPEVSDIMELIKLSQKVETAINERLNGKNSNVYDILGIMKPIESEPTHIFSPHMYNQASSKATQNSNNTNNISSSNTNKFNTNSEQENNINTNNNKFEQFDEDEKENINLDSVDHNNYSNNNNDNDIGSQAKSFFNNALNSISNFGGIIKDQIQNAKDTVIDSFTGNETNNNNYDNNYQQNDYYNNDSNYNNDYNNNYNNNNSNYNDTYNNRNSYNNENNINNNNNNDNNRKNSVEQNDQNTNEARKESFDSSNDLTYNRQDMTDIVNKLKEFDTRYNMFFNDEDKRNFRIIIDYLKAKM